MGKKSRKPKNVAGEKGAADAAQRTTTGENGSTMATPTEALLTACGRGNIDEIRQLLEIGCDVNVMVPLPESMGTHAGTHFTTPLYTACAGNQIEVARLLVNRGADVELSSGGFTPLLLASAAGHYGMVCLLIFVGRANIDCVTDKGATPFSMASSGGFLAIVRLLLDRGADVNRTFEDGATALHLACQDGHTEVVGLLIDRGADINAALPDGRTAFFVACDCNHYDIVELLMRKGAITDKATTERGILPLGVAISNGHVAIAELIRPGIMGAIEVLAKRSGNDGQLLIERVARSGDDSQLSAEHAAALAPLRAHFAERNAGKI
jgi:hypothetical protein